MDLYSETLLKGIKNIKDDLKPTFDALFIEKEPIIREWIHQRWLLGKKPDGTPIGLYFDYDYAEYKYEFRSKQAGFQSVDLIDEGSLWRHIEIFTEKQGIEIESTDEKFLKIAEKYGFENFNVTETEKEMLINEIIETTIRLLYKKYL